MTDRAMHGWISRLAVALAWAGTAAVTIADGPTPRPHAEAWVRLSADQHAGEDSGWPRLLALITRYDAIQTRVREAALATKSEHGWQGDFGELFESEKNLAVMYDGGNVMLGMARARKDFREQVVDAGIFDELDALRSVRSFARAPEPGPMIRWDRSYLTTMRWLLRANLARMVIAMREGDVPTATKAFESGLMLGRAFSTQPLVADASLGVLTTVQTLAQARFQASSRVTPSPMLIEMLAAMDRQQIAELRLDRLVEGERLLALDTLDAVFPPGSTAPDAAALWTIFQDPSATASAAKIRLPYYDLVARATTERHLDDFYGAARDLATRTGEEQAQATARIARARQSVDRRDIVGRSCMPPFERLPSIPRQIAVEEAGARLVLALEIHRVTRGFYPSTLAELVPGILPSLPPDPFDPKGYRYKLQLAASATIGIEVDVDGNPVSPYILYSIGADGEDNHGLTHAAGPQMATHSGGKGYDIVLSYLAPPKPILREISVPESATRGGAQQPGQTGPQAPPR